MVFSLKQQKRRALLAHLFRNLNFLGKSGGKRTEENSVLEP